MKKLRIITIIIVVLLLVAVLASCNKTKDTDANNSTDSVSGDTAGSAATFDSANYVAPSVPEITSVVEVAKLEGYSIVYDPSIVKGVEYKDMVVFSKNDTITVTEQNEGEEPREVQKYVTKYLVYDLVSSKSEEYIADAMTNYFFRFFYVNRYEGSRVVFYNVRKQIYFEQHDSYASYFTFELRSRESTLIESYDDERNYFQGNTDYICSTANDLIIFNKKVFRVDANGATTLLNVGELSDGFECVDYKQGEYYYAYNDKVIAVYDLNAIACCSFRIPSYAEHEDYYVLSNGNVFVQYVVQLADDDKDYDLIADGKKYDLVQKILNVKDGKETDLKTSYYFSELYCRNAVSSNNWFNGLRKDVENIAECYPIINKRIDVNYNSVKYLSISNSGEIGGVLNETIAGEVDFQTISADRIIIYDNLGRKLLCDYSGNIIGEVSNIEDMTDKYIVGYRKVYDMNLNVIFDYDAQGYTYYYKCNNSIFFSKEVEVEGDEITNVYVITSDSATPRLICDEDEFDVYSNLYMTTIENKEDGTVTTTIYNANGTQLFSKNAQMNYLYQYLEGDDSRALFCCYVEDENHNFAYHYYVAR